MSHKDAHTVMVPIWVPAGWKHVPKGYAMSGDKAWMPSGAFSEIYAEEVGDDASLFYCLIRKMK